ncbi:MAG: S16 family serine protease [Sulfuricellaceae bacterium]|nr:S16 family serine protease [Sulfuricellaceae bacterium]
MARQPSFHEEKPLSGIGGVTGKLGDVMKESAEIAFSYVISCLKKLKGDQARRKMAKETLS